ncbi:MAG: hypothetical protein EU530_08165 [Promethearchaeota archaeon]|nr:MAG: hypothetical protein EU530_08165 [Candidatus Lokiarchaeota archaeon]
MASRFFYVIEWGKRLEINYDIPEDDSKFNLKSITSSMKYEIWAQILESCLKNPRSQTWIQQQLPLKKAIRKEDLEFLLKRELIEIIRSEIGKLEDYKTTESGKQVFYDFYNLVQLYFCIVWRF